MKWLCKCGCGEQVSKRVDGDSGMGARYQRKPTACSATNRKSHITAAVKIKLDTAEYLKNAERAIMDLQASSEEGYRENLRQIKDVQPKDILGPMEALGFGRHGKALVDAWQRGDDATFGKLYAEVLRAQTKVELSMEQHELWWETSQKLHVVQDHLDNISGRDGFFTKEQARDEVKRLQRAVPGEMAKVAKDVQGAIKRIDWWNGSGVRIVPRVSHDEFGPSYTADPSSASIYVGPADFTYFGAKQLDDVLDAGDSDFFRESSVEQDYFNLVRELRQPGSTSKPGKLLKLYTARPLKDRKTLEKSARQKSLPNNLFLTDSLREAEGYAAEYPPRDIWKIWIYEKYVTETQRRGGMAAGNYQTMGPRGRAPIKQMEILQEATARLDQGMRIAVGQTWVSSKGISYEIVSYHDGMFHVEINGRDGHVTASPSPWLFHERKLRRLIKADRLSLYDASSKIDQIAERLDHRGHETLAAALDQIALEYVEGRQPKKAKQERVRRANEDLLSLQKELEEADDPEVSEDLLEDIQNTQDILDEDGPRVPSPHEVTRPGNIANEPPRLSEPTVISK